MGTAPGGGTPSDPPTTPEETPSNFNQLGGKAPPEIAKVKIAKSKSTLISIVIGIIIVIILIVLVILVFHKSNNSSANNNSSSSSRSFQ
jgi:hypothetical protein